VEFYLPAEIDAPFTRFQCPDCHSKVETYSKVDEEIEHQFQQANKIPLVSKEELDLKTEFRYHQKYVHTLDWYILSLWFL